MNSTRASNLVCVSCKLRKKKCDKARPRCGHCARKNWDCQYSVPDAKYLHLRPILAVPNPVIRSSILLANSLSAVLQDEPKNLNSTLHLQILRIFSLTDQPVEEISIRYFRGMHSFIPILSPSRFHEQLLYLKTFPSATFSILLLSMSLVTYQTDIAAPCSVLDPTTLYLTTKSLFAQVQSSFPRSLPLIQAGIIIASYEYATQKIDEAFASIGACARMGYAAGLHLSILAEGSDPSPQAAEEANTWWGIVIAERTIFCEVHVSDQPLVSNFRTAEVALLNEPVSVEWDSQLFTDVVSRRCSSLDDCDGLARVTQAAWLLDQVFKASEERDIGTRLSRLDRLDNALRSCLVLTMDQSEGRWGLFCTANAIIFRALFILHRKVIHSTTGHARSGSYVALKTATQMVHDIAATQQNMSLAEMDTLPPSLAFILSAALKYLDEIGTEGDRWGTVRTQLAASLKKFKDRWNASPLTQDGREH